MSNYMTIKNFDVANGRGIRTSIFFSGCGKRCKNCFNSEAWDFNAGKPFNREVYEAEIKPTINEHIAGISILGGEPFHPQNIEATRDLCVWFKRDFPDKDIWAWSGYQFEELDSAQMYTDFRQKQAVLFALKYIDVLVDGEFVEELKDLKLPYAGSTNQRVIDVKKTLANGEVVLYAKS